MIREIKEKINVDGHEKVRKYQRKKYGNDNDDDDDEKGEQIIQSEK